MEPIVLSITLNGANAIKAKNGVTIMSHVPKKEVFIVELKKEDEAVDDATILKEEKMIEKLVIQDQPLEDNKKDKGKTSKHWKKCVSYYSLVSHDSFSQEGM